MSDLKMVVTDLDGTLLQNDHSISEEDLETLNLLGELGICRVAATGRNLFKVRLALTPADPFDYVITVCGGARESCPAFIGKVKNRMHIGFDGPGQDVGDGGSTGRVDNDIH